MVVKAIVVDDAAVVRQAIAHMLADNAEVELIGCAPNPLLTWLQFWQSPSWV